MNYSNPIFLAAVFICTALAIRGLFKPFLGLLILMTLHFVQPGELFPSLAPLRIELVYGVAIFIVLLKNKGSAVFESFKTDPVLRGTLLLLGDVAITIPLAIWPGGAFAMFVEVAKLVILQITMTAFIDSQERLKAITWLLVGFMMWFVGSTFFAFIHGQFYSLGQTYGTIDRAQGINSMAGNPNELAGLLLAFLPFLMTLLATTKGLFTKVFLFLCGGMTLYVLCLTGARIVFLGLILITVFYVFRSKRPVLNLAVALVLAATLWFSLPKTYQDRFLTVKSYAEGGKLDPSNEYRLQIWDAGWRMFQDHPVLGVGAGQFSTAFGTKYSGKAHGAWMQPHNLYLQVVCELGIVGFIIFVYFLGQMWKAIREVLRTKGMPGLEINYQFASACALMFVGNAFIGLVSHTLYRPYWYMLAGLVVANRLVTRHVLATQTPAPVVEQPTRPRLPSRVQTLRYQ